MSRVAKNPIEIIDGVTVNVNDGSIDVKGKGVRYSDENVRRKEAKKAAGA